MSQPMYRTVEQPRSIITFVPSAVTSTHEIAVTRHPQTSQPLTPMDFYYLERMVLSPGATVRMFNGPGFDSSYDVRMIPVLPVIQEDAAYRGAPPDMPPNVDPGTSP